MLFKVIFLLALSTPILACHIAWPNGTETTYNWFQCNNGPIQFLNATPFDHKGNFEYPIHLSSPVIIKTLINNPTHTYSSPHLKKTIKVWSWSTSCKWNSVPTFGLLRNLDACSNGVSCPIKQGTNQQLDLELNFSEYGAIIRLLKDNSPYQLQYILHDKLTKDEACITFQAKARIH
uniref:ML domain-containing protein n=1 Tax=Heterorhabditis bacteriophora TaxID=37862 RepID=A0A1I7X040_HETBA